ncbi:MAG: hypothetical protein HY791_14030 [Deltaproteobacteria bacterium]|nr:hypothetical protein [Deltaproteobacteria bacterium]
MSLDGRYRIGASSRLEVTARAPGHDFVAKGAALGGSVRFENGALVELSAEANLADLAGSDPIGTHELRKFVGADRRPTIRGSLMGPAPLSDRGTSYSGMGVVRFVAPTGKVAEVQVTLSGRPEACLGTFKTSFSALGYTPPKLLFLKVRDELEVRVELSLTKELP